MADPSITTLGLCNFIFDFHIQCDFCCSFLSVFGNLGSLRRKSWGLVAIIEKRRINGLSGGGKDRKDLIFFFHGKDYSGIE